MTKVSGVGCQVSGKRNMEAETRRRIGFGLLANPSVAPSTAVAAATKSPLTPL